MVQWISSILLVPKAGGTMNTPIKQPAISMWRVFLILQHCTGTRFLDTSHILKQINGEERFIKKRWLYAGIPQIICRFLLSFSKRFEYSTALNTHYTTGLGKCTSAKSDYEVITCATCVHLALQRTKGLGTQIPRFWSPSGRLLQHKTTPCLLFKQEAEQKFSHTLKVGRPYA